MTKISTIQGIRQIGDIDTSVLTPSNINYSALTTGELALVLLKEQIKLKRGIYPDHPQVKNLDKAQEKIDNVLYGGLANHTFTGFWASQPEKEAARIIAMSKFKIEPANGSVLYGRKNPSIGTDPNDPLIPDYTSCEKYRTGGFYDPSTGYSSLPNMALYNACQVQHESDNFNIALFNDPKHGLEHVGLQMLYNWVDPSVFNDETLTFESRKKMSLHIDHVTELARLSKLDRGVLSAWISLGIQRKNAAKFNETYSPADTIAYLQTHPDVPILLPGDPRAGEDGIGNPFLILAIAVLVLSSAISVAALVQVFRNKEPTAFSYIGNLGSLAMASIGSPGGVDFIKKIPKTLPGKGTKPPGTGTGTNPPTLPKANNTTPLLIGGAALAAVILLSDK